MEFFPFREMVGLRTTWAVRAIEVIQITSMLFQCVSALNTHNVGDKMGWDLKSNLQDWAASNTFRVGEFLVFRYKPVYDVWEVHSLDYHNCNAVRPIRTYNDGKAVVIQLTKPGSMYFICSRGDHCKRGLKLQVQVQPLLSLDSNNDTTSPTTICPSSTLATSPPSDATSAPPSYGAGEILHLGYVPVIIVLVMLVSVVEWA